MGLTRNVPREEPAQLFWNYSKPFQSTYGLMSTVKDLATLNEFKLDLVLNVIIICLYVLFIR